MNAHPVCVILNRATSTFLEVNMTKSAKLFSLPILCLVLLTLITPKQALAQTGSMEGDVIGFDGAPLIGATVTIDRKDIKQHFEVKKTDKKGRYFHAGLPVAFYRVAVVQDGKELYYFDNVKVPLGDAMKLDFNLKKEADRTTAQPRELTAEEKAAKAKQEEETKKQDSMTARFQKGREFYLAKQYEQAAEEFKAAAEHDPTQHVIFANLAEAYKNTRKYDDAIQSYTKALEVLAVKPDPATEASYHMNLALVYALGGKMPEALAETEKSTTLNPSTGSKAYYNLGATLVNSGKASEAADAFKKATEVDPNNADAQYQLGICLMSRAQTTPEGKVIPAPGTVEAFQKYIDLKPNGSFAAVAKDMITTLSATVETRFKAEKEKPAPKKK
ncbi:MAG: tetratricopeptide repeat protein [Acidobacteria bacterium]|nr:tetratricopeptide repeat protein [Acidobacteriota bacterium]